MEVCKRRSTLRDKNFYYTTNNSNQRTSVGFDDAMPLSFDNDVQVTYQLFVQVVGGVKIIGMIDLLF